MMKYNTEKEALSLKEYGRHVHILVKQLCEIQDAEERLQKAYEVVKLLKLFNLQYTSIENNDQKIWDMLYFISEFKLKVNSPYPPPSKKSFDLHPKKMEYTSPYNKKYLWGKNVNELAKIACETKDEKKKDYLIKSIAHYIKIAYKNWHRKSANEEVIKNDIRSLSQGNLIYSSEKHFTAMPKLRSNTSKNNNHYKKDKRKSH